MDKEYVAYTYNGILFGCEKQGNTDICDNVDESWGHCVKWNNLDNHCLKKDGHCMISPLHEI